METYHIDKKKYYLASDLMATHPSFFKGCRTVKSITKKDKLPQNKYIFARKINGAWMISEGDSKKVDKLFISKKWYNDNYADEKDKIEIEPDLIHLENNEMFTDNDGNLIDIEVRGEREFDRCYFKVKDIMAGFELKNLRKIIIKEDSGFIENVHYKYFYSYDETEIRMKILYLTYNGLLKVLFGSRNKIAEKFAGQASKILFTAQMGNETQKQQLAADLIGVSMDVVKSVFNKSVRKIPCIYLFYIGNVKNLRKSLGIDKYNDDDYVCKWGMSNDLERRMKEHEKTYGKLKNAHLKLLSFGYIDPQYISKAETKVKRIFEVADFKLDHHEHKEIAIIPKNKIKLIKEQYETISEAYMGHVAELINKIKEKDNELELQKERHEKELQKERLEKELQKERHEKELLKKDLEIAQIKLAQKKNK